MHQRPADGAGSPAVLALLALAASHAALGLHEGLFDGGDYGLLWLALPFIALTVGAALCSASSRTALRMAAVVLTAATLLLALLLVPVYLLGVFHLPQAALATAVAVRRAT